MNIAVYLGSGEGKKEIFRQAARELGEWIGRTGHILIYGGSDMGLMGVLADAVLAERGEVIGVEPRFFVEEEIQHSGITKLIVTETMSERKQKIMELADAFVAFPGGIGTLEEIAEVMTLSKLGRLNKPFCFLNIDGYYAPFRKFLAHMAAECFLEKEWAENLRFTASIMETTLFLENVQNGRKTY